VTRLRIELEGGLYHIILGGNDRSTIFHSAENHEKLIPQLVAIIRWYEK